MSYTQAQAEVSKDAVLDNLQVSLDQVARASTQTIYNTIYHTVIGTMVTALLLIILVLTFFYIREIIDGRTAMVIAMLAILYILIVSFVIIRGAESYARKKLNKISAIAFNFLSSQQLLTILDSSAAVYLQNLPPVVPV